MRITWVAQGKCQPGKKLNHNCNSHNSMTLDPKRLIHCTRPGIMHRISLVLEGFFGRWWKNALFSLGEVHFMIAKIRWDHSDKYDILLHLRGNDCTLASYSHSFALHFSGPSDGDWWQTAEELTPCFWMCNYFRSERGILYDDHMCIKNMPNKWLDITSKS